MAALAMWPGTANDTTVLGGGYEFVASGGTAAAPILFGVTIGADTRAASQIGANKACFLLHCINVAPGPKRCLLLRSSMPAIGGIATTGSSGFVDAIRAPVDRVKAFSRRWPPRAIFPISLFC